MRTQQCLVNSNLFLLTALSAKQNSTVLFIILILEVLSVQLINQLLSTKQKILLAEDV